MKNYLNLAVGIIGTKLTILIEHMQPLAAVISGLSVACWMLTQSVLAILARNKKKNDA